MRYAQNHSFNKGSQRIVQEVNQEIFSTSSLMFAEYAQGMDLILRYENIESDLKGTFGNAGIHGRQIYR
jgi:hypothetical protein